jgi:hypothetical protein
VLLRVLHPEASNRRKITHITAESDGFSGDFHLSVIFTRLSKMLQKNMFGGISARKNVLNGF